MPPARASATERRVVATGRWIKGVEMLMPRLYLSFMDDLAGLSRASLRSNSNEFGSMRRFACRHERHAGRKGEHVPIARGALHLGQKVLQLAAFDQTRIDERGSSLLHTPFEQQGTRAGPLRGLAHFH